MMGQTRHIAHAEGWLAVATEPDLCKVGKCVVAFNSFARLDHQYAASPDVKARGTPVYRVGDFFKTTQANAGAHIVSGTALGTGYLQILEGHSNVKINAIPVARHDSACRINCDSTGMGGARGQIVTMTKTVTPAVANPPAAPRVSKRLLELKALRDSLIGERLNLDALDEIVNFDGLDSVLESWIAEIQGTPGTAADWDAQVRRGLLGGIKDIAVVTAELGYEGIKNVPKLIRSLGTKEGLLLAMVDRQILLEDISLGNLGGESIAQDAGKFGAAMVRPVTNPWQKGQYVEATTRAGFELFTLLSAPVKALRAAKAKKLLDAAKVSGAAATSSTTAVVHIPPSVAVTTSAPAVVTAASASTPAMSYGPRASTAVVGPATSASTPAVGYGSHTSMPITSTFPSASTTGSTSIGMGSAASPAIPGTLPSGTAGKVIAKGATPTPSGGVFVARAPKRMRPAPNGYSGPDGYVTHGITDSPLRSDEGRRLLASYRAQGISPADSLQMAREMMASGSTLPKAVDLAAGDALYKLVPEGRMPGKFSAFFATEDEIAALKGMSYDQISDRIGIPLESQQTLRFDVIEVRATKAVTVFESTIAGTSQNGYIQPGGGIQTLITNRSAFTDPIVIGKLP